MVSTWLPALAALALGACAITVPDYTLAGGAGGASSTTTGDVTSTSTNSTSTSSTSTSSTSSSTSSTSSSTSSTSTSSSSSSSGSTTCAADSDCAAGDFCWLGGCVRLTAIAAGGYHTCALTSAGGVQCWGSNNYGQLGNDSSIESHVPVAVSGLSSGVAAIAAGTNHTCAVTTAGAALCWGQNDEGHLGNNATENSLVPVPVSGLSSGVATIAADATHTCAVTTAGAVLCWGEGAFGQLGNNSTQPKSLVPVAVSGLSSGVAGTSSGLKHTCAVTKAGAVQCWGDNSYGQLGNNSQTNSPVPVAVVGLSSGVTAIGAGGSCALTTAGGLQCWGWNMSGQLGNNATASSPVPVGVVGLASGVAAIAPSPGSSHACALTTAGGVQCWGYNSSGELGNDSQANSHVPVAVVGLASGIAAVAGGGYHTCALTKAGTAQCWGSNSNGQLGNDSTSNSHVPVTVMEP